jgi:GTP-binding protein
VDIDEAYSGAAIERMAQRKGTLKDFANVGAGASGRARLTFSAPSRGLIGFQSELKTESRGTAAMHRTFDGYGTFVRGLERKPRAAIVANCAGQVTAYALDALQAVGVRTPPRPAHGPSRSLNARSACVRSATSVSW